MKAYVAGFYFSEDKARVVLIRKNKPEWQNGFLNAVGGKIEIEETPEQAMTREFKEEAGVTQTNWTRFCEMTFPYGVVYFFKSFGDIEKCRSMEDEKIEWHYVDGNFNYLAHGPIDNLKWLIPMALDDHNQDGSKMKLMSFVTLS